MWWWDTSSVFFFCFLPGVFGKTKPSQEGYWQFSVDALKIGNHTLPCHSPLVFVGDPNVPSWQKKWCLRIEEMHSECPRKTNQFQLKIARQSTTCALFWFGISTSQKFEGWSLGGMENGTCRAVIDTSAAWKTANLELQRMPSVSICDDWTQCKFKLDQIHPQANYQWFIMTNKTNKYKYKILHIHL